MESKSSIRRRMMKIFAVLILFNGVMIAALFFMFFWYNYKSILNSYLKDIDYQTTNNLENNIEKTENFSLDIITSQMIQESVRDVNEKKLNYYQLLEYKKRIEKETAIEALSSSYVVSVSVVTDTGYEFSVKKHEIGGTLFGFEKEEIYMANGSLIWKTLEEKNRICVARAILDLNTMEPIGYVNIVYEETYMKDILADNFREYSGISYVVNDYGKVMLSSEESFIGKYLDRLPEDLKEEDHTSYDSLSRTKCYYYVGDRMENGWTLVQIISVKGFYRSMKKMFVFLLLILAVILGTGVALVNFMTSYIAKPVQSLVESMKTLAKDNKYPRVQVTTNDEIGWIGMEYNKMAENIETMVEQVYKMELSEKQAKLEYLQMQINPHFLYNALDTISWMAIAEGNQEISEMTIALAELLRAIIKNDRFISLREELKVVKAYLMVQNERFGDKIAIIYDIDERISEYLVPNFTLQPLIENAITHGLEPKVGTGKLMIQIKQSKDKMKFLIEDDGIGMTKEETDAVKQRCRQDDAGKAIGLANVYKRLLLCYGEESRLSIESKENSGTRIYFSIPLERVRKSDETDLKK